MPPIYHIYTAFQTVSKICPNSATFAHELYDHLQADAAKFRIPIVDIYTAFGGDSGMASHPQRRVWQATRIAKTARIQLGVDVSQ
jgi:hypothetical protein